MRESLQVQMLPHIAQGLIRWFDEDKNVNRLPLHSPDRNPVEQVWDNAVQCNTIIQTPNRGISFGRMVFIPLVERL